VRSLAGARSRTTPSTCAGLGHPCAASATGFSRRVNESWCRNESVLARVNHQDAKGRANVRFCAGFRTPECRDLPRARTAGVRKAPRHEIAGCWAPTVQRALWGFGADVSVGEADPSLSTRWFWVEALACLLARMSGSQVGRPDLRRYHGPILRTGASGGAAGREPARMGCVGAVSDRQ